MIENFFPAVETWLRIHLAAFGLRLLGATAVLLAGGILARIAASAVRASMLRSPFRERRLLVNFFTRTTRVVIVVFAGVVALGQIGVNIGPLIAGIGITGFIVGFAFKDSLSNLAAGLLLLFYQPFEKGDYVEIGGTQGTVRDMSVAATELKMVDGRLAIIPNSRIWNAPILNFNKLGLRRIEWRVSVPQPVDTSQAARLLQELVAADDRILLDPPPQFLVENIGEPAADLVLRVWVAATNFAAVNTDLSHAIPAAVAERSPEIPAGRRVVVQPRSPVV